MKIILAESYGLCFGVRDALAQAEELARRGPLTMLGELVHNPIVREKLTETGVQEGRIENLASARTAQVMITAHGASDAARRAWREAGFNVADGTCPLVRHAHGRLAALVQLGYFPIVIGTHDHVEVRGLTGDFPEALVLETSADLTRLPNQPRYGVIAQTTQPIERVLDLVAEIRMARPESAVRFCDTVCKPTKDRQRSLHQLIAQVDVMIVVGGRHSNNTGQLVKTAAQAGLTAHHIERPDELDPAWFRGDEIVGLTAGTSTLHETVRAVQEGLLAIAESFLCSVPKEITP